jgi:hypothetical protein
MIHYRKTVLYNLQQNFLQFPETNAHIIWNQTAQHKMDLRHLWSTNSVLQLCPVFILQMVSIQFMFTKIRTKQEMLIN